MQVASCRADSLLQRHERRRFIRRWVARSTNGDALLDQRAADLRGWAGSLVGRVAHGAWGDRGQAVLCIGTAELGRLALSDGCARVRGGDALLGERAADLPGRARLCVLGAGSAGWSQAGLRVGAAKLGGGARERWGAA